MKFETNLTTVVNVIHFPFCQSFKYKVTHYEVCGLYVARHGNMKFVQNRSTVSNSTMEPYCIRLPLIRCRGVQRVYRKLSNWKPNINNRKKKKKEKEKEEEEKEEEENRRRRRRRSKRGIKRL